MEFSNRSCQKLCVECYSFAHPLGANTHNDGLNQDFEAEAVLQSGCEAMAVTL